MGKTLDVKAVSKSFGATQALKNVDITFEPGCVHVLIGENGAGKSTLLKIVSGVIAADQGQVALNGQTQVFRSPHEARKAGIAMVYQELTLLPDMTVLDNLFLGVERTGRLGILSKRKMRELLRQQCAGYGLPLRPDEYVRDLPFSHQQLLEVLKAIIDDPDIAIFDEATSSLDDKELRILFAIIGALRDQGKTIIFISHRLEEIFEIGDCVTVLKDGEKVVTKKISEINQDQLIEFMVGRSIEDVFPPKSAAIGEKVLEIVNLHSKAKRLKDINMTVHRGEIVGIAGLQGQGQTELLDCIAGIEKYDSGSISLHGRVIRQAGPRQAIRKGMILLPRDRKIEALFLDHSVSNNLSISSLRLRQKMSFVQTRKEKEFVAETIRNLAIKCSSPHTKVNNLSGGNQQKVILGRVLGTSPKMVIFNEPTRGVDVGTKQELYKRMRKLSDEGIGVMLYSSDILELIGISDTVYTMYEGSFTSVLTGADINEIQIMRGAVGMKEVRQ